MKSPKNKGFLTTSHVNNLISPESKTKTLSRTKGSNEGCIRRQVLSPNSGSTWMDSVNREESLSRISKMRSPQNVCFSPTIQQSRVAVDPDMEGTREGIMVKLQELTSMTTAETHIRKRTSDDLNAVYKRIEINQWESEEIDKLKIQLEKSYERFKEVKKRQKETEKRTLCLQEAKKLLQAEVIGLRERCSKKDDIIFSLEQKLAGIQNDYDSLQERLSTLQLQILSERNLSIQALKEHLLSFERTAVSKETSLHVNQSKSSLENNPPASSFDPSAKLRREVQQLRNDLISKQQQLQQKQQQWAKEKTELREQLDLVSKQLLEFKGASVRELKRQREKEDMYLLYLQATSIESMLKLKA